MLLFIDVLTSTSVNVSYLLCEQSGTTIFDFLILKYFLSESWIKGLFTQEKKKQKFTFFF